jgi:hypothetical protein
VFGGPRLRIESDISNPVSASDYTLQFIQNIGPQLGSGVRMHDFQAYVPEPTCASVIAAAIFLGTLRRRRGVSAIVARLK